MKWYWADWKSDPGLRACGLGARGLWAEMLSIMDEAEPYGHLLLNGHPVTAKQLVNQAGGGATERDVNKYLAELKQTGVYSVTDDGVIFCRRMVRDRERDAEDKNNGNGGGNPNLRRGTVPKSERVRPFKRSDSPAKTKRIFEKSGGRCHWCKCALVWDGPSSPALFHVDHVVPICDGGTNDEQNLVAACSDCNHKRARIDSTIGVGVPTGVGVGTTDRHGTDHKAQSPEARSQKPDQSPRPPSSSAEPDGATLIALADELAAIAGKSKMYQRRRLSGWIEDVKAIRGWMKLGATLSEVRDAAVAILTAAKEEIRDPWAYLGVSMPEKLGAKPQYTPDEQRRAVLTFFAVGTPSPDGKSVIPPWKAKPVERRAWSFDSPRPFQPGCVVTDEISAAVCAELGLDAETERKNANARRAA